MRLYIVLFLVCLLVVVRVISWAVMLALLTAALSVFDRKRLKSADFMLLLSFVCFFVFSGNLARIDAVADALSGLLQGRELVTAALTSQVISNVPAALLLSGFTENARELLLGVNIGGLGTPVASLASLISLKLYSSAQGADSGAIMRCFLLVNIFLGIIGTFWFRTAYRRGEMGLRMAMGSSRRSLYWLQIGEALGLVLIAFLPTLPITFNITIAELIEVHAMPISRFRFFLCEGITLLLLWGMAFAGAWYPARQSTRLAPAEALRYE